MMVEALRRKIVAVVLILMMKIILMTMWIIMMVMVLRIRRLTVGRTKTETLLMTHQPMLKEQITNAKTKVKLQKKGNHNNKNDKAIATSKVHATNKDSTLMQPKQPKVQDVEAAVPSEISKNISTTTIRTNNLSEHKDSLNV